MDGTTFEYTITAVRKQAKNTKEGILSFHESTVCRFEFLVDWLLARWTGVKTEMLLCQRKERAVGKCLFSLISALKCTERYRPQTEIIHHPDILSGSVKIIMDVSNTAQIFP